jgi:LPXTG-site transpeptidase (sortase) family protein
MDFLYQAKKIFLPAAGNRSMMVIWIFIAAALLVLASPNAIHDISSQVSPKRSLGTSPVAQKMLENMSEAKKPAERKPETSTTTEAAPAVPSVTPKDEIVIGKIDARVPIVTATTTNNAKLHALLDQGAVLYPTSAGFGNVGQTVLLGHSAPANWPNIKHDTAFSRTNELVKGDQIEISYRGRTYIYTVTRAQIIPKGGDLAGETPDKSWLVLVTCWPPGRDLQRSAVEAVLVR